MDYRKLDAALANEYEMTSETKPVTIFIHLAAPLEEEQVARLHTFGVKTARPGQKIATATLPKVAVEELSEQPWVQSLRLSRPLRLLQIE
jgi:hypothetical protein